MQPSMGAMQRPMGPCENAALHLRLVLLPLSGAPVRRLEQQAARCRKAGHRYYGVAMVGVRKVGCCLPVVCGGVRQAQLRAAAGRLLSSAVPQEPEAGSWKVQAVSAYTSIRSQVRQELVQAQTDPDGTRWRRVTLDDLTGLRLLPQPWADADVLAVVLRDFHGSVEEYNRLVNRMVTFLTAVLHKAVTIMIPSLGYSEYWMTPLVRIVQLPGLTFCGASNWRSKAPQVELGLELLVPPMWRFLLSGFGPPYVDAVNSSTPLQRDNILMPLPQQVCGSRDLDSQLQWLVPQDALSAAVTLGSIGGCSRALSRNLDELGELAVIVTGNTEVPWAEVERKALRCSWGIGAAYWDVQVDSNLWPKALNCSDSSACSELCAAGGQLRAFLCVPSRFAVEAGTRLLEPQPECNAEGILDQALGLLLAHRTGCWEFLAAAGPPTNAFLAGGGRDLPGRMDDAISHHGKWVQQIRSQRATLATESASLPSAAVCVAGRARSLIEPEVYRSIAQNAVGLSGLGAETSLFFVLDLDKRPMSELMDAFAALPPTAIAIFDKDGARSDWGMPGLPGSCEAWRRCGVACYHQFHKLQTCLRLIEAAEASRGKRFDWFVRIRPDTKWEAPIGDLAEFDQGAVHMSLTNFGENDDNFALVPRAFANAYFAISESCPEPHEAYQSTCAIPWVGSHIYPECAIQMRLKEMQVPWEPFPNIYRIKREAVCRPDDPRGCGRCEIGVCNVAPPD